MATKALLAEFLKKLSNSMVPMAAASAPLQVYSATLPASGGWQASDLIRCGSARRATLWIKYTSNASGGDLGYPEIVPLVSAADPEPAPGDDSWYVPGISDGTITSKTLAGSLVSGADFDVQPDFGQARYRGLVISTEPADGNSDDVRIKVDLDVTAARYLQLHVHEAGDTTNRGDLTVLVSLSA